MSAAVAVLACAACALGAAARVSAFPLLLPMFYVLEESMVAAAAFTAATLAGSAVVFVIHLWPVRHATADRPIVALDAAAMLMPITLIGISAGVTISLALPTWVHTLLVALLLAYTARQTMIKALAVWAREGAVSLELGRLKAPVLLRSCAASRHGPSKHDADMAEVSMDAPLDKNVDSSDTIGEGALVTSDEADLEQLYHALTSPLRNPLLAKQPSSKERPGLPGKMPEGYSEEATLRLSEILERERHPQLIRLLCLTAAWLIALAAAVLRGGHGLRSPLSVSVPCGGVLYWTLPLVAFVLLLLLTHLFGRHLHGEHLVKRAAGYAFLADDVLWEGKHLLSWQGRNLPLLSAAGGVVAGTFGVGGATVMGPLMLQRMGMQPDVASATTCLVVALSASSTALQYGVAGVVSWGAAVGYALAGALGTAAGLTAVGLQLVRRFARVSLLASAIAVVTAVCALMLGALNAWRVAEDVQAQEWDALTSQRLCSSS